MTRWHDLLCVTPDVFVTECRIPACRGCGRTCPSAEDLFAQRKRAAETLKLPVDELPGQMNLWWPRSVPYLETGARKSLESPLEEARSLMPHSSPSEMYEASLKASDFRLACLTAVADPGFPLHLSLETFADDDHPEYECTSYTWAGEDGDSSLRQPIYIGDYWDVLLRTQNCSCMLRFLCPWRGTRMV
jgi:hypothetical protein